MGETVLAEAWLWVLQFGDEGTQYWGRLKFLLTLMDVIAHYDGVIL